MSEMNTEHIYIYICVCVCICACEQVTGRLILIASEKRLLWSIFTQSVRAVLFNGDENDDRIVVFHFMMCFE